MTTVEDAINAVEVAILAAREHQRELTRMGSWRRPSVQQVTKVNDLSVAAQKAKRNACILVALVDNSAQCP